jgi:hypothetical protein
MKNACAICDAGGFGHVDAAYQVIIFVMSVVGSGLAASDYTHEPWEHKSSIHACKDCFDGGYTAEDLVEP